MWERGKLIHESYGQILAVVKYWKEVEDTASAERQVILKNCHGLLLETVRDLLRRFPELKFVTQHLRFVDPTRRERVCCNIEQVLDRFNNGFLNRASVLQEYALFRNDESLDILLQEDGHDPVTHCQFWCTTRN